jgi:formylglycine-generating enzyme required for sulfatase activity
MVRFSAISRRDAVRIAAFVAASTLCVAAVVAKARHDSADPARCEGLVARDNRCCASGQRLEAGRCVGRPERCPLPLVVTDLGCVASPYRVAIDGGRLHPGAGDWEAEGRTRWSDARVAPFEIDVFEITEGAYAECVAAGRCASLPASGEPGRALAHMSRADVEAYCSFRGGRLLTDDEWTLAAAGPASRRYPWGDTGAVCRRAAWGLEEGPCGFGFSAPELAGAHPDGVSREGVHDLAGNVAEWVTGGSEAGMGLVRGGSFATSLATHLRTWHARALPADTRSPQIGGRCGYDAAGSPGSSMTP